MADGLELPEEQDDPGDGAGAHGRGALEKPSRPPSRLRALDAFSAIQRQLAAIDYSALAAAQRAFQESSTFRVSEILAAQDLVAKHFAESIDFSQVTAAFEAVNNHAAIVSGAAAQRQWAESLAESIDLRAINAALVSSAAVAELTQRSAALIDKLKAQTGVFARIMEGFDFRLPTIDVAKWLEALDRWIPINLREVDNLDDIATLALTEGLPLSWIPRTEIVIALAEASTAEERDSILDQRRDDILDDCDAAVGSIAHEWAAQCRVAIAALRAGFEGPAQSHASNIVDSIVLGLHGKNGRGHAKKKAQEELDGLPLQLAAENLTLRPLFRAFTAWWPESGLTPPEHFARHTTAHAVGHAGVFASRSALIAVMLATSLVVQYAPNDIDAGHDRAEERPEI